MKIFKPVTTEAVSEISCDCCKRCFKSDDTDRFEIQSIEFVAGYFSIFGDGNSVSIDLCQNCLKQNLGPWLRVDKSKVVDDFADSLLGSIQREFGGSENLTPPQGYQSWLHYAVETMETRSLELEGFFDEWPDHAGRAVSREEMREAARRELFQVLKGRVGG
jgi:hypothetical protein